MSDSRDGRVGMSPLLTLADAGEILGVAATTVRALIQRGELVAFQIGARKQWRIEETDLVAYKDACKAKQAEAALRNDGSRRLLDPHDQRVVAQYGKVGHND